jgi:hypothetical protein
MAAAAVASGPRIVVVAALESTLEPTVALVREGAVGRGPVEPRTLLVDDAWARFEAGDTDGYLRVIADAADSVTDADAIVLAQASMAPARHLTTTAVPVLSSPELGLAAAATAAAHVPRPGSHGPRDGSHG